MTNPVRRHLLDLDIPAPVNVSTAPREVTLTIYDAGRTSLSTTCPSLDILHSCTLAVPGFGSSPHSCRIDVAGGKTTVRASIVRLTADGIPAVALPAQ